MIENQKIVVVGLGEVGKPLRDLAAMHYQNVVGVDLAPVGKLDDVAVLHICIPYEIRDFIGETERYMDLFNPAITIINSTVGIGTTRAVAERTGRAVVNSPIRGKHARMLQELQMYTKFVGALDQESATLASEHFQSMGMKTRVLATPEATELAKLTETTYFGVLIAWAQELERYCEQAGANYDEVVSIFEDINYLPRAKFWPGVIGGHCVMPNIEILSKFKKSDMLDAIRSSNEMKIELEANRNVMVGASK